MWYLFREFHITKIHHKATLKQLDLVNADQEWETEIEIECRCTGKAIEKCWKRHMMTKNASVSYYKILVWIEDIPFKKKYPCRVVNKHCP